MKANMQEGRSRKADADWRASWRRWEEFFFCLSPDFFFFSRSWVFSVACRLSLVLVSKGYSLVVVHRLLISVASLVAEHGL